MENVPYIWMNGEIIPWADATVHIGTHALHYGTGVFEGVRAYDTPRGPGIVRLDDHMQRLHRSGKFYYMDIPYSPDELADAVWSTIAKNELESCYIRPIAFRGFRQLGIFPLNCPVDVAIMMWPWGAYLGDEAVKNGISAKISSWQRFGSNVLPPEAKATGQYLNSVLAKLEAHHAGYEEAILLNSHGNLAEGSGENLFVVKGNTLHTPAVSESILQGITRDTVLRMARDLGIAVRERAMTRTDLYTADEIFMTGTAAEVTPIHTVDDHHIGEPGPITRQLQDVFFSTIRGEDTRWADIIDYAPDSSGSGSLADAG